MLKHHQSYNDEVIKATTYVNDSLITLTGNELQSIPDKILAPQLMDCNRRLFCNDSE